MMMKNNDGSVHIDLTGEEILDSMAHVKAMRDFCKELPEGGAAETVKALQTAFEVMMAYYGQNYGEE